VTAMATNAVLGKHPAPSAAVWGNLDVSTLKLRGEPTSGAAGSSSASSAKLRKAAGEFESMLLENLWKSMKETFTTPEDDSDPILQSFDDWAIHGMASAVGQAGGLGIKNMIVKYLEPRIGGGSSPAEAAR
jgi:Rod binding domain-containing protein